MENIKNDDAERMIDEYLEEEKICQVDYEAEHERLMKKCYLLEEDIKKYQMALLNLSLNLYNRPGITL